MGILVPAAPCASLGFHHGQHLLSPPQQGQIHLPFPCLSFRKSQSPMEAPPSHPTPSVLSPQD